ncbi:hypothetical protein OG909_09785 [Streptomyces sp. NBC_01754]|uniref:hypothetical protein n=1 Tax=Streptomyces sp. NBC_01754 TaxID=2975930 RepID=UPI002DD7C612|nr:hypothetical protein [Streptomyces sp. NBC_01754]WSC92562.1 hypothetical protein OG909_09785 [Streptomyces sp. NBC_01754]
MHQRRSAAGPSHVLLTAVALAVLAATAGCQQRSAGSPGPAGQPVPPPAHGKVFLGPGDCGSRGDVVREVSCRSEKAAARVLARYSGAASSGPDCPPATDFVLHVAEHPPAGASPTTPDGVPASPEPGTLRGYACMRNLEPPHPGDPGQGGGPLTVVGDCVYSSRAGEVKETACDGSDGRAPEFEVTSAVRSRDRCPGTTALYVQLGGDEAVGCAHRVR